MDLWQSGWSNHFFRETRENLRTATPWRLRIGFDVSISRNICAAEYGTNAVRLTVVTNPRYFNTAVTALRQGAMVA